MIDIEIHITPNLMVTEELIVDRNWKIFNIAGQFEKVNIKLRSQ
jgi:hypothetical protein